MKLNDILELIDKYHSFEEHVLDVLKDEHDSHALEICKIELCTDGRQGLNVEYKLAVRDIDGGIGVNNVFVPFEDILENGED